jgi:hypothetical protein
MNLMTVLKKNTHTSAGQTSAVRFAEGMATADQRHGLTKSK